MSQVRASLSVVSLFFVLFCGCGLLEVLEMCDVECLFGGQCFRRFLGIL